MAIKVKEAVGLAPLPYYKWHWQRFRANRRVQRMDYIARGLYRELLDEQWADGSISNDLVELADICGCPVDVMREKWMQIAGCFESRDDGRLFNQVLEDYRTEKDGERLDRKRAGTISAIRRIKQAKQAAAHAEHLLANAESVSTHAEQVFNTCHIEEKRREEKSKNLNTYAHRKTADERADAPTSKQKRVKALTQSAELCHAAYPRKVAKEDSLRAFIKHIAKVADARRISDAEAGEWMISRVKAYAASPSVSDTPMDKIPYPASWANAGRYDDPSEAWESPAIPNSSPQRLSQPGYNAEASTEMTAEELSAWRSRFDAGQHVHPNLAALFIAERERPPTSTQ